MNDYSNLLGMDIQSEAFEATSRPMSSRNAPSPILGMPSRKDWEERLASLRAELEELDQDIFEEESLACRSRSRLRDSREEILTRITDLTWLLSTSER
jgi:hypothetical protein